MINMYKVNALFLMCFILLTAKGTAAETHLKNAVNLTPESAEQNNKTEKQKKSANTIPTKQTVLTTAKKSAKKPVKNNKKDSFTPTEAISEDLAVSFPTDI